MTKSLRRTRAVFVERFDGPSALVLREVDIREPEAHEVLIEVHAGGVNFPDLLVSRGAYQDLYPLPYVIGKEGAGVVRAVGAHVDALAPGDPVAFQMDTGCFSELVVVPAVQCYPVPSTLKLYDAAGMVLAYQTAYFALTESGRLKVGEWLMVTGASGGVGIAAVQLGRVLGARVIACVGGPAKAEFVRSQGSPDFIVDMSSANLVATLRDQIMDITAGHGTDVVLDPVGGDAFNAALRTLAPGGRLVVVGFASGTVPSVMANYLLLKHIAVVGVNWGVYRDHDPQRVANVQAEIFKLAAGGQINSPVTEIFTLSEAQSALGALEERRSRGKIVLTTRYACG
jgi:NADPH2:quinone reductase